MRHGGTRNQQGYGGIEGGGQTRRNWCLRVGSGKRDREGLGQLSSWSFSGVRSGVPWVIQRGVKLSPANKGSPAFDVRCPGTAKWVGPWGTAMSRQCQGEPRPCSEQHHCPALGIVVATSWPAKGLGLPPPSTPSLGSCRTPRKESCPDPWLPETPGTGPSSPFTQKRKSRGLAPPPPPHLTPPDCTLGPHVSSALASQGHEPPLLPASPVCHRGAAARSGD